MGDGVKDDAQALLITHHSELITRDSSLVTHHSRCLRGEASPGPTAGKR